MYIYQCQPSVKLRVMEVLNIVLLSILFYFKSALLNKR